MVVRSILVSLLVAASGAYAYQLSTQRSPVGALPAITTLPSSLPGGWVSRDFEISDEVATVLDADVVLQRGYRNRDGAEVLLFLAYFKEQQVNSQIHSPRQCVPGGGWKVASLGPDTVALPSGALQVSRMHIRRDESERQLVYWFRTRGGTVCGEYALKWDLIQNSIARRPTDALFVRFSAKDQDVDAMHEVIRHLDQPINAILADVGL